MGIMRLILGMKNEVYAIRPRKGALTGIDFFKQGQRNVLRLSYKESLHLSR